MNDFLQALLTWLQSEQATALLEASLILLVGLLLARVVQRNLPLKRLHAQHQLVLRRLLKYLIVGITVAWSLRTLGVSLELLLGTAGILTVAIGFAAQTSASNLISGIFLMVEQPFVIGDVIKVGDTNGEVVSVDLLSVRLRTFDNLLVRIPNETMLKANVTNYTRFPVRRLDMKIGVAYKEDISEVRAVLEQVADANLICLEEPKPLVIFLGYGDSSLDLQFSVWSTRENFLELRNTMHEAVKRSFDAHGIEIPFPQRTIHTAQPACSHTAQPACSHTAQPACSHTPQPACSHTAQPACSPAVAVNADPDHAGSPDEPTSRS